MTKANYIPAEKFKICNSCGCDCLPEIIWENSPLCKICAEKWGLKTIIKKKKVPSESTMVQSILSAGNKNIQSS